ncbi:SGNH/GDSL hydrolase family protein [Gramella sp. GC03-9]|uniref:SGNH/GDSL hydrolase family protein n=1 Tax=Christiangramia oceanisediminis TaxID=2920386 RepID=A0A9X2I4M0_9FLAO|nr:SGNH/GDSL hydrolase family protein [Gramella oceanisediminis]MCP9199765.1 SGNH/GDSL hydrolase family protein [Gramella oceanisediminis]
MKKSIFSLIFLFVFISLNAQNQNYKELMEQDWPELKRYHEENQQIIQNKTWPKVVFMGNSITEGWVNMHPEFFSNNNYVGRGISGQTSPQMLIRFTPDVLDLKPEVVVILAGTNDLAANTGYASVKMISDNIKAMATLADQNDIRVVLSSVLPVYDYPWRPGLEPVSRIQELNTWMEKYAREHGYVYLDYFSNLSNAQKGMKKEYSEDGVHPNAKAYSVMEPLVQEAIANALDQ